MERLVLPPYLDLVVFDILHEAGAKVDIFPPGSPQRALSAEAEGVEEIAAGRILRTVVVHRPAPGIWSFHKPNPGIRIKVLWQRFFPRSVLIAPRGPRAQKDCVAIAYRLMDQDGSALAELPGYPLRLEASLTGPDGIRRRLRLKRRFEAGFLTFRAEKEAACILPGRYWTQVVVATRDFFGRRIEVFRDKWSGFLVHSSR
jgi:hypothetical protein